MKPNKIIFLLVKRFLITCNRLLLKETKIDPKARKQAKSKVEQAPQRKSLLQSLFGALQPDVNSSNVDL